MQYFWKGNVTVGVDALYYTCEVTGKIRCCLFKVSFNLIILVTYPFKRWHQIIKHLHKNDFFSFPLDFSQTPYPTASVLGQFKARVNCQRPRRPRNRKHLRFSLCCQQRWTISNPIMEGQQGLIHIWSTQEHRSKVLLFRLV